MSADGLVALGRQRAFANPSVFLPAWSPVASSRALRGSKPLRVTLGPVELALWRDHDGVARAFAAACPHLGADLGAGRVVDRTLRCAIHHWRFHGDGTCAASTTEPVSSRCAAVFPVVERYGLVFVHPSRTPPIAFPPLPDGDDARDYRTVLLPSTRTAGHQHLTTSNGLDAVHFEALHDLESVMRWHHDVDDARFAVHLHVHHRHRHPLLRALLGDVQSRFSAHGPSIAWVTATAPVRMHALFCTRPDANGSSSRAVLFLPRGSTVRSLRTVAFLFSLLRQDGVMLDAMKSFHPGFVDSDAPMRDYAALLERWPRL